MIRFDHDPREEGMVVALRGRLDLLAANDLREVVTAAVADGHTLVVLDLGPTEFVDSSGLGAVVAGLKTARQAGGDLRIANVAGQVELVLGLTKLDRVLRPYPSVDAALQADG